MKPEYLLITTILALHFSLYGQSETIRELKLDAVVEASFYFYPSTLRALNQGDNLEFNNLIRAIKKMSIFRLDDSCTHEKMTEIRSSTMQLEGYEALLSVEGPKFDLHVIGKEEPSEYIIFIDAEGERYIADILGSIDLWQIPKLYRKIKREDSSFDSGIIAVLGRVQGHQKSKPEMPQDTIKPDTLSSQSLEN